MVSIAVATASPILVQLASILQTAALALLCVIPRAVARSNAVAFSSFILSSFSRRLFKAPGHWTKTFFEAAPTCQKAKKNILRSMIVRKKKKWHFLNESPTTIPYYQLSNGNMQLYKIKMNWVLCQTICKNCWKVQNDLVSSKHCYSLHIKPPSLINPLNTNINMHILHAVLDIFPEVLTRRICLTIKSFFGCDHFLCSHDLNVGSRGDIVMRK